MSKVIITDSDALKQLCAITDNVKISMEQYYKKAPALLAKLSHVELARYKEMYATKLIPADWIDRLVAYGRGELPEHLARPQRTLRLTSWQRLNQETKKLLSDPDNEIKRWTHQHGMYSTTVGEFLENTPTVLEALIHRDRRRLMTPTEQRDKATSSEKPKPDDVEEYGGKLLAEGENVLFYLESGRWAKIPKQVITTFRK